MELIKTFEEFILNEMKITDGQNKDILKKFPKYDREKSYIEFESGSDNGETFNGTFIVKIYGKGVYRFDDGEFTKKVK